MAELGPALTVYQVAQIAGALVTQAYKYGEAVKNSEKDIKHVQEYLGSCEISIGPCSSFYITPSIAYERVIRSSLVYMNS
jgi:hypothetical protein